ncbi:AAA family ATPase [Cytophagales bacterium LB-30]|uniref:AAA family ATPase n=1 Tax=Shiella aurantiaca TaxID=3058365 RepID=A0ABT8F1Y0_9BACT|nr:AAA family ATPase [Shiella aurantiaca]MDN4164452.1 AAA family ATPase [Shiella aurantiaca]
MTQKETFIQFIDTALTQLNQHRQVAFECEVEQTVLDLHDKLIDHCGTIKELVSNTDLSVNYINQFQRDISQALGHFPFRGRNFNVIQEPQKIQIRTNIENQKNAIEQQLNLLVFNLDFFNKLGFFNNNIVAIGANGSGKTSLSNKLKTYIQNNGVVISAQRILFVPTFETLHNPTKTAQELKQTQLLDKSNKDQNNFHHLHQEFGVVLKNLLADSIASGNEFRMNAIEQKKKGEEISDPPITNLDRTLEIWNSLIEHRTIKCIDGMNINVESETKRPYPAIQMSDGEKVMLFLIAQVLQAPKSGFIIVDEPEMYLHKTILKKLWDILEKERQDCIFVYLTHDLDFATSRTTAKKIWIRSFIHPDKWDIENIPENDLPEPLLLELLGSRKNILFCEGKKGSIDEKIYNILFPSFTITPVDNCFAVINYTKAFNKLPNSNTIAFGIIDSDHHGSERLKALEQENVFSLSLAEPENLFLDEDFLKVLSKQLLLDESIVNEIKTEVLVQLKNEIELQTSNYVSAKINYYFKDSHVSKGNTLATVNDNYNKFSNEIKIQDWYDNRKQELEKIIADKNYNKVLSVYNNKGLKAIANKKFKITDFTDRAIKQMQFDTDTHDILRKHFPEQLKR